MCSCTCSWSASSSRLPLLWLLEWFSLWPSSSGGAKRPALHRRLQPRTPDDCPACRHASTPSSGAGPAPQRVRPWHEVKSRRGARHSHTHRRLRLSQPTMRVLRDHRGSHPRASPRWQTWPLLHRSRRSVVKLAAPRESARHDTPLYHLKTPSQQVAMVLSALAEGLDPSAAERVFGNRQATITTWLTRAGGHAEILHERCFRNLQIPHLQLDELRTRLRCATQVRLSVAGHRSWHEAASCAPARPPHPTHGPSGHPFPATDPGSRLPSPLYQ